MQSAIATENSSEQQAAPAFQEGNDQLLNAKIVIVDDESTTMEVVKAYLEETGYRNFVLIEESIQALAALERQRPDLLLLDLKMPKVSGFDLLRDIRKHPKLKHLPDFKVLKPPHFQRRIHIR